MYEKHFPQCLALVNNNQYTVSNIIMISKPQGHAITGTGQMNHFAQASKLVLPGKGGGAYQGALSLVLQHCNFINGWVWLWKVVY